MKLPFGLFLSVSCLPSISLSAYASTTDSSTQEGKPSFNAAFLRGDGIDIEKFLSASGLQPGSYRVELFLNNQFSAMETIQFVDEHDNVKPCINSDLIERLGVIPVDGQSLPMDINNQCIDLDQLEHANWQYEQSTQRLYLFFPQTWLVRQYKNYISPDLWDDGVSAAFTNYSVQSRYDHMNSAAGNATHTAMFNSGVNLGSWRFRNQSNFLGQDGHGAWRSERSYIEHDLSDWHSQFSAGQIYSRSEVFDTPALVGMQVRSDESMLPDELRGYSPVVSGIAESNATVEIRQGGTLIYSMAVAPGPFEIRDIPTYGSNGDLEITVVEADGQRRIQTQGFGMLPVMVREGVGRYQFSLGKLDTDLLKSAEQWYASVDGAYGITSDMTLFGGAQWMRNYYAINSGLGIGTRFGSLSFDITHSDSDTQEGHYKGESYRFRFGRTFHDVGTTLALAGYRYATEDYRSLNAHVEAYNRDRVLPYSSNVRSNVSANVTQRLPSDWGSLGLSASEQDYWDKSPKTKSLSANYGNSVGRVNYQLNVQRSHTDATNDTRVGLYASYPLSLGGRNHTISVNNNYSAGDTNSRQRSSLGLSGSLDDYSYSLNTSTDYRGNNNLATSGYVRSAFGEGGLGYSQGSNYRSSNAHWNGALVAHAGGINAGPTVRDGFILAEVPDIEGVGFNNSKARTAKNGFAVIDQTTPYRRNEITIDSKTLPSGVEAASGNGYTVPRRGSINKVTLHAKRVERMQFTLLDKDGKAFSFGTQLETESGDLLALADPNGRALAMIEPDLKAFAIRDASGQRCNANIKRGGVSKANAQYGTAILQCTQ